MPKDRRANPSSSNRATASPYYRGSLKAASDNSFPSIGDEKEWDDTRCPICMEHPHNAVLLLCSSHDKGCRPFICDTSYRHSNCLDQFHKSSKAPSGLLCPLCRGTVLGSEVVQSARKYMDLKTRSCSLETCSFSGNYADLRRHARMDHPFKRPSEASPTRQSNWAEMERQRDIEDVLAYDWDPDEDDLLSMDGLLGSRMSDIENSLMDHIFELNLSTLAMQNDYFLPFDYYDELIEEEMMMMMDEDMATFRNMNLDEDMATFRNMNLDEDMATFRNMNRNMRIHVPMNDSSTSVHGRIIGSPRRQENEDLIVSPRRQENQNRSTSLRARSRSSYDHRVEANRRSGSRSSFYRQREYDNTNSRSRTSYNRRNDDPFETRRQSRSRYQVGSSSRRQPRSPPPPRYRSPSPGRDFPGTFRRQR